MPQKGKVEYAQRLQSWPFLGVVWREIKVDTTKECYQLLVTLSLAVFSRTAGLFPLVKKNTIPIYTENKILSHGLYNWAYTLIMCRV